MLLKSFSKALLELSYLFRCGPREYLADKTEQLGFYLENLGSPPAPEYIKEVLDEATVQKEYGIYT